MADIIWLRNVVKCKGIGRKQLFPASDNFSTLRKFFRYFLFDFDTEELSFMQNSVSDLLLTEHAITKCDMNNYHSQQSLVCSYASLLHIFTHNLRPSKITISQ
jgi:hypothetical protein